MLVPEEIKTWSIQLPGFGQLALLTVGTGRKKAARGARLMKGTAKPLEWINHPRRNMTSAHSLSFSFSGVILILKLLPSLRRAGARATRRVLINVRRGWMKNSSPQRATHPRGTLLEYLFARTCNRSHAQFVSLNELISHRRYSRATNYQWFFFISPALLFHKHNGFAWYIAQ